MERMVVNLKTGAAPELVPLTAAEAQRREAEAAEFATIAAALEAEATNAATLRDRAETAIAKLETAYDGWADLTAAGKDAALKLNVRATIALARLVLRKLDKT